MESLANTATRLRALTAAFRTRRESRQRKVLGCLVLACLVIEPLAAQDLSLQVNFIQGERLRGEVQEVAFVVANPTTAAVSGYRVDFFASLDTTLDEGDHLLGSFQSTERLRDNAFQENRIALDTCGLALAPWRIFGRLEDVQPGDSDRSNDTALASGTLLLNRDDDDPTTCPEREREAAIINPGLNDAWFDPATPGQGFFINVFGATGDVFLAWFTYDTQRPGPTVRATLGDPGQRWLTAFGTFSGASATLEVTNTRGGRFDRAEPAPVNESAGTITLRFENCGEGTVAYELPGADLSGVIPIERVVGDNIPLCESLADTLTRR